jgi:hypothetical protein
MATSNTLALCGWGRPKLAEKVFRQIREACDASLPRFVLAGAGQGTAGQRFVAWDAAKLVTGGMLAVYEQQVGDCVGNGWAQALGYQQCVEIVGGDWERFRPIHASYAYATSREVGGWKISGDGSLGAWMAEAGRELGNLPADEEAYAAGVPRYAGALSRRWGRRPGPPEELRSLALPQLVKTIAPVRSYEQLRDAIVGAKSMCTIASMMGFRMRLELDARTNKHWFVGKDTWPHQMCLVGCDDDRRRPGVFCLNSWGSQAHGPQADGPAGGGWIDAEVIDRWLRDPDTECFALSAFDGFKQRELDYRLG